MCEQNKSPTWSWSGQEGRKKRLPFCGPRRLLCVPRLILFRTRSKRVMGLGRGTRERGREGREGGKGEFKTAKTKKRSHEDESKVQDDRRDDRGRQGGREGGKEGRTKSCASQRVSQYVCVRVGTTKGRRKRRKKGRR